MDIRHRVVPVLQARTCGLFAAVVLLTACAGGAPSSPCSSGEERSVMETVYFGTAGAQRFLHLIQSGKRLKPVRQTRSQRSVK